MWHKLKNAPLFAGFIGIVLLLCLSGCGTAEPGNCRLPCQLGIDQAESLTVEEFENALVQHHWIQYDPDRTFYASYAPDRFSAVLETTASIVFDGRAHSYYGDWIILYISYVGGISPDHDLVPQAEIDSILVSSNINILESWLLYGFPEGGIVLPFYTEAELMNPCLTTSFYFATYDGGKTIIRAEVLRPILLNMWTTPVEVVYPVERYLEYSAQWVGQYWQLEHRSCMP